MRAKSINQIREMVKQNVETTCNAYKTRKRNLEEKYKIEWLDNVITKEEKEMLDRDRKLYNEAYELFEDFENHQW